MVESHLRKWLEVNFHITKQKDDEVMFPCPVCHHPRFYFNLKKKIGWCHRASCHVSPTLKDLEEIAGGEAPLTFISDEDVSQDKDFSIKNVPGEPIFPPSQPVPLSHMKYAVDYLAKRAISLDKVKRFQMTYDGIRIYIPIMDEEGNLVSYIGRDIHGITSLKYKTAPGSNISSYLFGWAEAQYWDRLTIVENTFVSIWLRNILHCVSSFGSNLSKEQIKKISGSKAQSVAILWDEGAETRAEQAVMALRENGVPSAYALLTGQPDNYTLEQITKIGTKVHKCALQGKVVYDGRKNRL